MEVYDQIAALSAKIVKTTDPEARLRMNAELLTLSERLPKPRGRKAEFSEDLGAHGFGARSFDVRVKALYERPARTDEERHVARTLDDALIVSRLLRCRPTDTRTWRDAIETDPAFRKAWVRVTRRNGVPTQDLVRAATPRVSLAHGRPPVQGQDGQRNARVSGAPVAVLAHGVFSG